MSARGAPKSFKKQRTAVCKAVTTTPQFTKTSIEIEVEDDFASKTAHLKGGAFKVTKDSEDDADDERLDGADGTPPPPQGAGGPGAPPPRVVDIRGTRFVRTRDTVKLEGSASRGARRVALALVAPGTAEAVPRDRVPPGGCAFVYGVDGVEARPVDAGAGEQKKKTMSLVDKFLLGHFGRIPF